jgi:hypothetical protein
MLLSQELQVGCVELINEIGHVLSVQNFRWLIGGKFIALEKNEG